jgi:hypothetical protein
LAWAGLSVGPFAPSAPANPRIAAAVAAESLKKTCGPTRVPEARVVVGAGSEAAPHPASARHSDPITAAPSLRI